MSADAMISRSSMEINSAFGLLRPLIDSLPESEPELTMPDSATAWKALHEFHPSLYATWKSEVRKKCGGLAVRAIDAVVELPQTARPGIEQVPPRLVVSDLESFLAEAIPSRKPILAPIILEQSLTMIHAWRGAGKTHVALGIAYAVSSGGRFLRWQAAEPRKVLYLDGEMPGAALQERLAAIVKASDREPPEGFLRLATPDKQPRAMPDLATLEGQAAVDAWIEADTALIIVDNLSCLVRRGGPENEAESWLTVAEWVLMHRARGRSILFIHHSGKNGQQRGTSKREDLLDAVLVLKQPRDYSPADGAVFEVHFEKSRGLYGEDVAPFEAKLTTGDGGVQAWVMRAVEDSTIERVIELHGLGLNQNEIAQELSINKSNVCRALKKAESLGRLTRRESGK